MPEVGTCQRTGSATAMYLYESKHGEESPYHGRVVGVASVQDAFRSLAFMFTPLGLDSLQSYDLFTKGLTYLFENFNESKSMSSVAGYDGSASPEILKARKKSQEILQEFLEQAEKDPEFKHSLGLDMAPPVVKEID